MSRTKRSKSSRKRPVAKRSTLPPEAPANAETLDELEASFDKFVLPGRIPDASDPYWKLSRAEQAEWRARGLAHAAGRGWQPVPSGGPVPFPASSSSPRTSSSSPRTSSSSPRTRGPSDDAQSGAESPWVPASAGRTKSGGTWPKGWIPGDPPIDHVDGLMHELSHELEADPVAAMRVFDAPARVRFLDCLATVGEVAAAARRVGVSRETAYRARRRYADFARLWDAALLHARARAEGELASRALDGVKVPVFVRGECVATYRKHDARYLFALLARLDRRAAECPEAADLAGRFDAMLALHAGHDLPEAFAEAAGLWDDEPPARNAPPRVPTRDEFAAWCADEAMEGVAEQDEDRAMAEAEAMAREEYDNWHEEAMDTLDAALVGAMDLAEDELPSPLAGEGGAPSGAEGEGSAAQAAAGAGGAQAAADAADPSPNPLPQGERAKRPPDPCSAPPIEPAPAHPEEGGPEPVEGVEVRTESPLPPAGGAGGGPVTPTAASDRPTPNPSRKREGESAAPIEPSQPPIEFKSAPASLRRRAALARGVSDLSTPPPRSGGATRAPRTLPPVRTHL